MNRRDIIKGCLTLPLINNFNFASNATEINKPVFESVFEPIHFASSQTIEFPLNFIGPGEKRTYAAYVRMLNKTHTIINEDYILVPTPFNNKNQATDYDYGATLLVAGLDRNLLVYDSECSGNYVSKKLQELMNITMIRTYGIKTKNKLTDIFIHESKFVENPPENMKVHRVNTKLWDRVLSVYEDFPEICKYNKHLNNKTNLVIGVSVFTPEFIKPIIPNGNYGIAVLENRNIILGAY